MSVRGRVRYSKARRWTEWTEVDRRYRPSTISLILQFASNPTTQLLKMNPNNSTQPGRSALEDTLGEWLNGNHQAELEHAQADVEVAESIARAAEGSLNDAIRYYNQWSSLDDGVSRIQSEIVVLLELSDMDSISRNILTVLYESLQVSRRIAMQQEYIDLTTDEEMSEEEHAMVIDLTQD